jgi:hypothetical protein
LITLPNIQDPLLQDTITTAVNDDRIGVVRLLINRGLDLNMTDRYGQNPLDYALQNSNTDALDSLITHDASPVLKCDPQSRYIMKWKDETWFPRLLEIISKCDSANPQPATVEVEMAEHVVRREVIMVNEHFDWRPYVSLGIPEDISFVRSVIFTTESHDQGMLALMPMAEHNGGKETIAYILTGWSDKAHIYGGTYNQSFTWFDAEIATRGKLGKLTRLVQTNVHASRQWRTHVNTWDVHDSDQSIRNWLAQLQGGDVIQVYPKARYPGWVDFVRRVEIEIKGMRETES